MALNREEKIELDRKAMAVGNLMQGYSYFVDMVMSVGSPVSKAHKDKMHQKFLIIINDILEDYKKDIGD